jgi:hypothetical protein
MTLRSAIKLLLGFTLGLPVLQTLLFWIAELLEAMGDIAVATFFHRVCVGVGAVWLAAIVGLVVALAFRALADSQPAHDEPGDSRP